MRIEKEKCCGCQACVDSCPKGALSMKQDAEGFWYLKLKKELCVQCGKCEKVCPMKNQPEMKGPDFCYGARAKDEMIRYASSSGGMFSVLAQYVLKRQGIVYGASYNDEMEVVHRGIENEEQLETIRRTKYVQSDLKGVYARIKVYLEQGRLVLFCGTPCQAQALRLFLNEDPPGLIVVDLICYGAASPGVWRSYVRYLEHREKGKMTTFSFRDKRNRNHGRTRAYVISGKETVGELYQDAYCRLYFGNYILRPSCHQCPFCTTDRSSDFTLGDFWGIEKVRPDMDDKMGNSLVIVHTKKAKEIWEQVKDRCFWFACREEDVLQPRLLEPTKAAKYRELFMKGYRRLPFSLLLECMKGCK